jgi:hypothetical protein
MDYLIIADIKITSYMVDEPKWKKGKLYLVDSDSEENAVKKLEAHLEKESDQYGDCYQLWSSQVAERI